MILINKKEVNLNDLAKVLGIEIPMDLIKKKPLYEINPHLIKKDIANGPLATKVRQEMDFPAMFRAKDKKGNDLEIRYCENMYPDAKTEGRTQKYSPKYVTFEGRAEFVTGDLDKAVYFWLHPFNKTSPYPLSNGHFEYELVNDEARANTLIKQLTMKGKAVSHATNLKGDQLMIIAKGLKIPGVQNMDVSMVRAQLMQFANDNPEAYLRRSESQVLQIEGAIVDAIDKGIFKLEDQFNTKRWIWNAGTYKGDFILEIPSSITDHNEALISYIKTNLNEMLPIFTTTYREYNMAHKAEKALSEVDLMADLGVDSIDESSDEFDDLDYDETVINEDLPTTYNDAMDFLGRHIGKKPTGGAKALSEGVKDGSITKENIMPFLDTLR